ncbi:MULTISPECIES: GNAT family N-acetyltransferase [Vibrio]|uniref:GNAT family N-acetyltransferase n=1 Tax=Vibrio TaxID=662 RepID=UPI001481D1A4|nr:GNAT family N-acetyltransferase [Vibrio sp. A11]EKO3678170.1 GNAT family N-acetyltransferase [Vibrio metschnikovii]EKO3914650.1 GNAT family N-acetyltransferase [Vibrio metschnikovii]NNN62545.1 GNAT family N-acetyltransferase [Vibrio sp. A11]
MLKLRKAEAHELDLIYSMGFDVWGDGLSFEDYLAGCRNSEKYLAGTWYVLVEKEEIVSSLIVYSGMFDLKEDSFGIGSVATPLKLRNKGYASKLVNSIKSELFDKNNCKALYLHSDIGQQFYTKLGFVSIRGSDCMIYTKEPAASNGSIPTYF